MKGKKRRNNASTSSDDEAPLVRNDVKQTTNVITEAQLMQKSVETCEFCNEVFFNKYNLLVHNASHIIIPLIKQTHQCRSCLRHFQTIESLEWHTINTHPENKDEDYVPELLKSFLKKEPTILVKTPIEINKAITNESLLQSFVKKEPITLVTKDVFSVNNDIIDISDSNSSNEKCDVKPNINNDMIVNSNIDNDTLVNSNIHDDTLIKSDMDDETLVNLKGDDNDNINFEDDINSDVDIELDGINVDFDDELHVKSDDITDVDVGSDIEMKYKNEYEDIDFKDGIDFFDLNDINESNSKTIKEKLQFEEELEAECKIDSYWTNSTQTEQKVSESIHYDDLMTSGEYKCKKCSEMFPNRYDAIIHETSHAILKRKKLPYVCRICDWYIAGMGWSLRSHYRLKHPDHLMDRVPQLHTCESCGLKYVSKARHYWNYHRDRGITCPRRDCKAEFKTLEDLETHKRWRHWNPEKEWSSKVVRVCDMCYSFFKNRTNCTYEYHGEHSQVGIRNPCERCQKSCFTLKIVQLRFRRHNMKLIVEMQPIKKKGITREERLKNIQQRLKKLKSLNKF